MANKQFRTALAAPPPAPNAVLPQIILYDNDNQGGDALQLLGGGSPAMGRDFGNGWNDDISSAVVISGTWELFENNDYGGRRLVLTPGVYPSIEQAGLGGVPGATSDQPGPGWNDILSSIRGNW